MKNHSLTLATVVLIAVVLAGITILKINPAAALTIGTSSDTGATSSSTDTTTPSVLGASTSTTSTPTDAPTTATPLPTSLTLVHLIGTKYVDYCTDGTKIAGYPGDPAIDSHFNVPNAPTPKCPSGQTWDHTSGMDAYDTPSGDLQVGDYTQQSDGTYLVHYAAITYTDATSTSSWPNRIVTQSTAPTSQAAAPSTTP